MTKNEYVYIMTNSKSKGIVKIGRSNKHPESRAEQLTRSTGTYGKYETYWMRKVEDSALCEKLLHFIFKQFQDENEFFAIDESLAKDISDKAINSLERFSKKANNEFLKGKDSYKETIGDLELLLEFVDEKEERNEIEKTIVKFKSKIEQINNGLNQKKNNSD